MKSLCGRETELLFTATKKAEQTPIAGNYERVN